MEMIPEMVRQVVLLDDLKSDGEISYRNRLFPERDGPFPEEYKIDWLEGTATTADASCF